MLKREPYRNRIELLQGTLDLLILQTLQWGPQHDQPGDPRQFRRCAASRYRFALPRAAPAGTQTLDHREMGGLGKSPADQDLPPHTRRQKAVAFRTFPLAPPG